MIDGGEADDKIIAVLKSDNIWGDADNIDTLPEMLVERLRHYFLTYKLVPGTEPKVSIEKIYAAEHAKKVVSAAIEDYDEIFGK